MVKALVTGGAGFIGSHIVSLLQEEGHDVVVLDNMTSGHRANLERFPAVHLVQGDVRDSSLLDSALVDVEVVFHLAASVGNLRSVEHPIEDSEINVIGTLRVLEAARHAAVRKVVYSSSAAVFGELRVLPIREDHPLDPDSPYGVSKLAGEKMCLAYARLYDLETVCLRYFNVYGVNQRYDAYGNVIPIVAHQLLHGRPVTVYGDGEQTRDFVNARDVAQANVRAGLTKGVSGVFNIASGTAITINRLVRLMGEAGGVAVTLQHGPPRKGDVRDSVADTSAARLAFGYSAAVGLRQGLAEYMDWAKAEMMGA